MHLIKLDYKLLKSKKAVKKINDLLQNIKVIQKSKTSAAITLKNFENIRHTIEINKVFINMKVSLLEYIEGEKPKVLIAADKINSDKYRELLRKIYY